MIEPFSRSYAENRHAVFTLLDAHTLKLEYRHGLTEIQNFPFPIKSIHADGNLLVLIELSDTWHLFNTLDQLIKTPSYNLPILSKFSRVTPTVPPNALIAISHDSLTYRPEDDDVKTIFAVVDNVLHVLDPWLPPTKTYTLMIPPNFQVVNLHASGSRLALVGYRWTEGRESEGQREGERPEGSGATGGQRADRWMGATAEKGIYTRHVQFDSAGHNPLIAYHYTKGQYNQPLNWLYQKLQKFAYTVEPHYNVPVDDWVWIPLPTQAPVVRVIEDQLYVYEEDGTIGIVTKEQIAPIYVKCCRDLPDWPVPCRPVVIGEDRREVSDSEPTVGRNRREVSDSETTVGRNRRKVSGSELATGDERVEYQGQSYPLTRRYNDPYYGYFEVEGKVYHVYRRLLTLTDFLTGKKSTLIISE